MEHKEEASAGGDEKRLSLREHHLGYSQNYGPHLVIDYIMAPNIWEYQNGTLILGTTHLAQHDPFFLGFRVQGARFRV